MEYKLPESIERRRTLSPEDMDVLARELMGKNVSDRERRDIIATFQRMEPGETTDGRIAQVRQAIEQITGVGELPNKPKEQSIEEQIDGLKKLAQLTGDTTLMATIAGLDVRTADAALLASINAKLEQGKDGDGASLAA